MGLYTPRPAPTARASEGQEEAKPNVGLQAPWTHACSTSDPGVARHRLCPECVAMAVRGHLQDMQLTAFAQSPALPGAALQLHLLHSP